MAVNRLCSHVVVAATISAAGCVFFRNPMLDIPISTQGTTHSPPFRLYSDTTYGIFIGIDPMSVDETTCDTTYRQQEVSPPPLCHEIRPAIGAIKWILTQRGKLIAQGMLPAQAADLPRGRPNSWAEDKNMTWEQHGSWFGHPGDGYEIEINWLSEAADLAPLHPRLAIVQPL